VSVSSRVKVGYVLALGILAVGTPAGSASAQIATSGSADSSAAPRFQVATIKPSSPEESRTTQIQGNRFATTGTSVVDLLKYAYGLQEQEIVGGPKWLGTEKFDVVGDPETQTRPSSDEFKQMVQNLLTDRFHLTAHHETRDLSVYEIVVAKGGPKLEKNTGAPNGIPTVGYSPGELGASNATLSDFAKFLQRFVADRPVVDGTGITGKYDWSLRWTPDELQTDGNRQHDEKNNPLPGLFTAIQEQLGLKLQEEKRPVEVFVVDHVGMPTEN
jgi:uncharacterized protein (TIGR03435 family)